MVLVNNSSGLIVKLGYPSDHEVIVTIHKWSEISDKISKNYINNAFVEELKGTIVEFCLNSNNKSHGPVKLLINKEKIKEVNSDDLREKLFNSKSVPQ